jgi:signal transduction histidine kinase/ActR/RegA family two-component response regulator
MSPEMKAPRFSAGRARAAALALAFSCACAPGAARAQIPTFGIDGDTALALGPLVEVYTDASRTGDPEALLMSDAPFEPPLGVNPSFGIDPTRRWYRFALHNEADGHLRVYIDVSVAGLDRVTLHHVEGGRLVSSRTGDHFPFDERPIRYPSFVFPLTLEPDETRTFLVEVETGEVHSVLITASGESAFVGNASRTSIWNGIFFGILFLLTLRHALAYFTTRSREELWYVLQSVSVGLYVAALIGYLYERWPDAIDFNRAAGLYAIGVVIFTVARFGVAYLSPRGWPRRALEGLSVATLVVAALSSMLPLATIVSSYLAVFAGIGAALLGTAFTRARAGSKPAALYLVAWAPAFALGWAVGLAALGRLPFFHVSHYFIAVALVWERVVVSAALQLRVSESVRNELRLREEALVAAEDRRKLESERQRGRRLESLGRLSGGIAHDFNNLLQAIGGYIYIVTRQETLSEKGLEHLEQAKLSVQRAADLTRKLLVLGRSVPTEAGGVEVDATLSGLEELLRRVLPADVTLVLERNAGSAAVPCDRAQLELCVTNLCLNARDAMPKGGTLTISSSVIDDRVVIQVVDTGEGIPREHLDRVFEPFFTTKTIGEGTGLGLMMVHGIVTSAGGSVRVESEMGVGTRFELEMPITPARGDEVTTVLRSSALAGSERILFVDDTDDVRAVGVAMLEEAGYDVTSARDGVEAAEIVRDSPPFDLVVTDVVMPRMGGAELSEWLASHAPGVPVLICTAYRPDEAATRLESARLPILRKPYGADELLHAVRALLDLRRGDERVPPGPHRA